MEKGYYLPRAVNYERGQEAVDRMDISMARAMARQEKRKGDRGKEEEEEWEIGDEEDSEKGERPPRASSTPTKQSTRWVKDM